MESFAAGVGRPHSGIQMRYLLSILILALPWRAETRDPQDVSPLGTIDFSARRKRRRFALDYASVELRGGRTLLSDRHGRLPMHQRVFAHGQWRNVGSISGNLSAQTDLATALSGLQPLWPSDTGAVHTRRWELATFPTSYPVLPHAATHGKLVPIRLRSIGHKSPMRRRCPVHPLRWERWRSGRERIVEADNRICTAIASAGTDYVILQAPQQTSAVHCGRHTGRRMQPL